LKEGTISFANRSTSAVTTLRGMPFSFARASAASRIFGSYKSLSISTWRLVREKGRTSRWRRFPISSSTRLTRRRMNQRTLGISRRSTAAHAARRKRTAANQTGRVRVPLMGMVG